jgi:hypothetical protein
LYRLPAQACYVRTNKNVATSFHIQAVKTRGAARQLGCDQLYFAVYYHQGWSLRAQERFCRRPTRVRNGDQVGDASGSE